MWFDNAIFYHVYPLGALGALSNKEPTETKGYTRLAELKTWLPHLVDLGINALYLGPVFSSDYHGYDTKDYTLVDPRLGTNADLKDLVESFHANGIKIILDAVFNHSGRNFFAFQNIKEQGSQAQFKSWYKNLDFSRQSPQGDNFSYESWAGCYDLVKFNLGESEVQNYLITCALNWIKDFNIDGLRLDAADVMDTAFMKNLSLACKKEKEDFYLMGEIVHGDYNRLLIDSGLDSVTNYECYKGLWSSCNDLNCFEIAHSLKRQFGSGGIFEGRNLYSFADNHDVDRVASSLKDKAKLHPLYILLFTMPGTPSIYYASEFAKTGKRTQEDEMLRPYFNPNKVLEERDCSVFNTIKRLANIRKNEAGFSKPSYKELSVTNSSLAFARSDLLVTVNILDKVQNVQIALNSAFSKESKVYDVLNNEYLIIGKDGSVPVYSNWGRILKRA